MSEESAEKKAPAWLPMARNVSDNIANIRYPTDIWGFTSELRKEFAKVTGKLHGHEAKTEILLATLAIMASHVNKRKGKDVQHRADRRARVVEGQIRRKPLETFNTPKERTNGTSS